MHTRVAAKVLVAAVTDQVPTLLAIGCCPVRATTDLLRATGRHGTSARIISISESDATGTGHRRRHWPEGVVFVSQCGRHLANLRLPPAHGALVLDCCPTCRPHSVALQEVARALEPGSPVVVASTHRRAMADGLLGAGLVRVESRRARCPGGAGWFLVRGRVP